MRSFNRAFCVLLFAIVLTGCSEKSKPVGPDKIASIQIIDKNGITEAVSSSKRIEQYQNIDFLSPQPYKKVQRNYGKDESGRTRSYITSYYESGQVKQYLEAESSRANGKYMEWHPNGTLSLECKVVGGQADITPEAESSWVFDGLSRAWNEDDALIAEIRYAKGIREGISTYYHANGKLWRYVMYKKGEMDGPLKTFLNDGSLFSEINYVAGKREGEAVRYWGEEATAFKERYENDLLVEGKYYDKSGKLVSEINDGFGNRAVWGKEALREVQEYKEGLPEGLVSVFDEDGRVKTKYRVKNFVRHGEEVQYYKFNREQPKLTITWSEGKIHGVTTTWYKNGNCQSRREMSDNKKNGVNMAWYEDGKVMLIEEYENDKLMKGEYFKKGEKKAVSKIYNGRGIASMFDSGGHFVRKVNYKNGYPVE